VVKAKTKRKTRRNGSAVTLPTVEWKNGNVCLIEQTPLPEKYKVVSIRTVKEMWHAIKRLAVRGAPAIGCAAAYGAVLGVYASRAKTTDILLRDLERACDYLATSRPTAVNLFWALERMRRCGYENRGLLAAQFKARLLD